MRDASVSDPAPTPEDYSVAGAYLDRMGKTDATTRKELIQFLAVDRAKRGGDRWDLWHGLRPARNPMEEADRDHIAGRITNDQRCLVYALHPPVIGDVWQFFRAWRKRIGEYANTLHYIEFGLVQKAREFADGSFGAPNLETRLTTEQIEQVYQYLTAYKNRSEPVKWGRYEASSWHRLAGLVCDDAWRQWAILDQRELTENGLVKDDTSHLIDDFPSAETLWARLEIEQAEALQALRESLLAHAVMPPPPFIPEDSPRKEAGAPSSSPPASAAVANGGRTQEPKAPPLPDLPEAIEDLDSQTPPLDSEDKQTWVLAAEAARLEGKGLASLKTYRDRNAGGQVDPAGTLGIDKDGRIWRKKSQRARHVYYFRPSLRSSRTTEGEQE